MRRTKAHTWIFPAASLVVFVITTHSIPSAKSFVVPVPVYPRTREKQCSSSSCFSSRIPSAKSFFVPVPVSPRTREAQCSSSSCFSSRENSKEAAVEMSHSRGSGAHGSSRRNFVLGSSAAAILSILGAPQIGAAADDVVKEDGRIVLRTSSNNLPIKYVGTSADAAPVSQPPLVDSRICGEDVESRRINVFERVAPSVVYIDTFVEQRDAFSPNVMEVPLGAGSGFVWDDRGHIVTNYHVVRNAAQAQIAILTKVFPPDEQETTAVSASQAQRKAQKQPPSPLKTSMRPGSDPTMTDFTRKVYKAKVVGVDPGKDIAVLKVDAPVYDLYPIEVGTSKGLRVGQGVLAIGNPFGLDHTLTSGIISGLGREIKSPMGRPISNVIQTDAAINPGNSGGPLLDNSGKLVGMSTAIFSTSGANAGIGFAIPIDSVKYIVDTLIRDGKVIRPVLGVSLLESKQARALGISKGVLVLDVPTSSPAFKAGMKGTRRTEAGLIEIGDIIVKVDDYDVDRESDLFQALESYKPGDRVKITVNRPEPESPTSSRIKLKEVVLNVQLTSSEMLRGMTFKNGGSR